MKHELKFTPRQEQIDGLKFVSDSITNKIKFLVLELPTGVGKSYLNMMIADWYMDNIKRSSKFDILTNQKMLQQQYTNEFKSINNLWGKENYYCNEYSTDCDAGSKYCKIQGTSCETCPYQHSKFKYMDGITSLTNFHMYCGMHIFDAEQMKNRDADVLIIDEAHEFEEVFSDALTIRITPTLIKSMLLTDEAKILEKFNTLKSTAEYIDFLNEFVTKIKTTAADLAELFEQNKDKTRRYNKTTKILGAKNADMRNLNALRVLKEYESKINWFIKEYKNMPDNWLLDRTKSIHNEVEYQLQPIWVHTYMNDFIFSKYKHVIMLSGTILNTEFFGFLNGLDAEKTAYYSIPSPFKKENRMIYYFPLMRMNYQNKLFAMKQYVPYINKILKKYDKKKGIIHTVTYELTEIIKEQCPNSRLVFPTNSNKIQSIKSHATSKTASVLVSPSMNTGIDMKDDLARFQVLIKIPYPSLASSKNKIRQQIKPEWYVWKTVSTIIQTVGRAVRHDDDFSDFIILDGCFGDLLKHHKDFFPKYILESLKLINV